MSITNSITISSLPYMWLGFEYLFLLLLCNSEELTKWNYVAKLSTTLSRSQCMYTYNVLSLFSESGLEVKTTQPQTTQFKLRFTQQNSLDAQP